MTSFDSLTAEVENLNKKQLLKKPRRKFRKLSNGVDQAKACPNRKKIPAKSLDKHSFKKKVLRSLPVTVPSIAGFSLAPSAAMTFPI